MEIVKSSEAPLIDITLPENKQASFALNRVVANIKRGTTIAHFPAGGVAGIEGTLCNYSHDGDSTMEWGSGTTNFGNWSSELGEVFYQALSSKGLNVAGNPKKLFDLSRVVQAADYLIGARITEIRGNFCQVHDVWQGNPKEKYSGELYVNVEWTVYSSILQREVLTLQTSGYFKLVKPKRQGIAVTLQEAFAAASENLLTSQKFVSIAVRKVSVDAGTKSGTVKYFVAKEASSKPIEKRLNSVLSSVVTVRLGRSHGSGFVISEDGLILTNYHVVGESRQVSIILNNGLEIVGSVLARHKARDVALIKIPLRVPSYLPLRTELPGQAERVFVVGSPIEVELQSTITTGVVSAIRVDPRTQLTFIQSDAAISPGNSGGPLFDQNGNVIGISVLTYIVPGSQSLNLFIPIKEALDSLNLKPKRRPRLIR
jgi:S1-C subfamily serine protease